MRGTRKDYDTPTREVVLALVQTYLDAPARVSDGGFAEVPEGDKDELDALILALVKYRYEPDSDGDRPIRWSLCDWHREQPGRFVALPRERGDGSNMEELLSLALLNLSVANSELQYLQGSRCLHLREKKT
jgi:hypothetical protein